MTTSMRRIIKERLPFVAHFWRVLIRPQLWTNPRRVFSTIHATNRWGNPESLSGPGSTLDQTTSIRAAIPGLLEDLGCRSMLDIPCGDLVWMKYLDLDLEYIGADVVPKLIESHGRQFAGTRRRFMVLDILRDPLPAVDVILCRDCLVHFSSVDVLKALANIKSSGSQYLLTTTFVGREANYNIPTGDWRALNLERAPFNLGPPLRLIDEKCTEGGGRYSDKSLGLWKVLELPG